MTRSRSRWQRLTERLLRRLSRQARSLARSDQGVALAIRVGALVATACVVSNLIGAAIVFVIAGPVRPSPADVEHPTAQLLLNLGWFYLAFGAFIICGATNGGGASSGGGGGGYRAPSPPSYHGSTRRPGSDISGTTR